MALFKKPASWASPDILLRSSSSFASSVIVDDPLSSFDNLTPQEKKLALEVNISYLSTPNEIAQACSDAIDKANTHPKPIADPKHSRIVFDLPPRFSKQYNFFGDVPALTWKCSVCNEERPDKKISVRTVKQYNFFGNEEMTCNYKYCNDRQSCIFGVLEK